MTPQEVIEIVAGLRSARTRRRRHARPVSSGSLIPKDSPKARYVVCNGDEGRARARSTTARLMEVDPHALLEGMVDLPRTRSARSTASSTAAASSSSSHDRLEAAIARGVRERTTSATRSSAPTSRCEMVLHRGAGAYICGEETALLESLEGYRGMPRSTSAVPGRSKACTRAPTVVNNVQSLQARRTGRPQRCGVVPPVGNRDAHPGTLVCSVSGAVNDPRNVEVPLGTTARRGPRARGRRRRPWHEGVRSRRLVDADACLGRPPRRADGLRGGWSRPDPSSAPTRSSRCRTTCASSGRSGEARSSIRTNRAVSARRVAKGRTGSRHSSSGSSTDVDVRATSTRSIKVNTGMSGFKSLCALAEFAAGPVGSSIVHFRDEYEEHIRLGRCPMSTEPEPAAAAG